MPITSGGLFRRSGASGFDLFLHPGVSMAGSSCAVAGAKDSRRRGNARKRKKGPLRLSPVDARRLHNALIRIVCSDWWEWSLYIRIERGEAPYDPDPVGQDHALYAAGIH